MQHENDYALIQRGIIGDFRAPDVVRFGICPLYVSYADVFDAVSAIIEILQTGEWDRDEFKVQQAVT